MTKKRKRRKKPWLDRMEEITLETKLDMVPLQNWDDLVLERLKRGLRKKKVLGEPI